MARIPIALKLKKLLLHILLFLTTYVPRRVRLENEIDIVDYELEKVREKADLRKATRQASRRLAKVRDTFFAWEPTLGFKEGSYFRGGCHSPQSTKYQKLISDKSHRVECRVYLRDSIPWSKDVDDKPWCAVISNKYVGEASTIYCKTRKGAEAFIDGTLTDWGYKINDEKTFTDYIRDTCPDAVKQLDKS